MNWATKLFVTTVTALVSAEWARRVVLFARPGLPRLILALPALAAYSALPFLFEPNTEMLSRASVAAIFMWLASFKVCERQEPALGLLWVGRQCRQLEGPN